MVFKLNFNLNIYHLTFIFMSSSFTVLSHRNSPSLYITSVAQYQYFGRGEVRFLLISKYFSDISLSFIYFRIFSHFNSDPKVQCLPKIKCQCQGDKRRRMGRPTKSNIKYSQ